MKLKEIVEAGLIYVSLIGLANIANIGTQKIDEYNIRRSGDRIELSPAPSREGILGGLTLVDEDGDRIPDKKYGTSGTPLRGSFRYEVPVTELDRQVFYYITSKL